MKKIPTLFVRDRATHLVTPVVTPGCEWALAGEGTPTLKFDGTCCLVRDEILYKRRELKAGEAVPAAFELAEHDPMTGKTVGWMPITDAPEDQYHREAWKAIGFLPDGTYELMGPKVQRNTLGLQRHIFMSHTISAGTLSYVTLTFDILKRLAAEWSHEGLVWHHANGRAAKLKRSDFGFEWPIGG